MGKHTVVELRGREAGADPLTELLRVGARQLIHQAVEAELQELLEAHSDRNLIERFFCRLKHFRRIATRYEKLASRFSSFIALVAAFLWLI